jgi:epoxyqueuosine reductase
VKLDEIFADLQRQLLDADFKSAIVSIERLPDLRQGFEKLLEDKSLDKAFYDEIVSRYGLKWHFDPPASFSDAKSIILTAAPQPKVSLEFEFSGKKHYANIPPTYIHDTDQEISDIIAPYLQEHGYKMDGARLPTKLLAVRSGLAKYGRNNITYIDGWGSYYRLRAFFSDMPCKNDHWQEPVALDLCSKCTACIKKCPTQAISADRFLVNAGKCLTFFNEASYDFPEWLDPTWHNCLIGCMICQDVCPANKEHTSWIMPGGEFSEEETQMILQGVSGDKLPAQTSKKLEKVAMLDDYELLQRNLRVLLEKEQNR